MRLARPCGLLIVRGVRSANRGELIEKAVLNSRAKLDKMGGTLDDKERPSLGGL